jgi:putative flippase GtrA
MAWVIHLFWKIWNFWFALPDKIRFLLVGGFNACVQYVLYILFLYLSGGTLVQTALILSWVLSTFSSFSTQKFFVFCTPWSVKACATEYIKCIQTWIVAYVINAVILYILVDTYEINAYGAQILAITCTTVSSYILFKYFAFKHEA